jgi:hypothetical protein
MMLPSSVRFFLLAALPTFACAELRESPVSLGDASTSGTPDSGGPGAGVLDAAAVVDVTATTPPGGDAAPSDLAALQDTSPQAPDVTAIEAQTECSAGLCLCSGQACNEGVIHRINATAGPVVDMTAGGQSLFLAITGLQASSILRVSAPASSSPTETVVKMGTRDAHFAVDADPTGDLVWCSEVGTGASKTGELAYGNRTLDTGRCDQVRRRDQAIYFHGESLYRLTLEMGSSPQFVSGESMTRFEVAGDSLYFVGDLPTDPPGTFLKRLSLMRPTQVDTVATLTDDSFFRLLVDRSHVYLMAEGKILRVPQGATAQPEILWQDPALETAAMAQTESHIYWSTSRFVGDTTNCAAAGVWRRAKSGGDAQVIADVRSRCAGDLVVLGDRLYLAVFTFSPFAGSELVRVRL